MPDQVMPQPCCWFAVAVKPRFDQAVARTLELKGYETLLPMYRKPHRDGPQSRNSEQPLFPGYVCCRFDVRRRESILMTPGVIQILGDGPVPIPLVELEVSSLQAAIRSSVPLQPFPFIQTGQRARIEHGSLAGVEGIVMSLRGETLRLVLSLTLLQRSVLLEVHRDSVQSLVSSSMGHC